MYEIDLSNKTALITSGTRGIGLGCGRALGQAGATCILTYKWGSADLDEIREQFCALGAPEPIFEMADVSHGEDTQALIEKIAEDRDAVDIFINNVAFAARTPELADYKKRSFFKSLEYSAWPLVDYVETIRQVLGRPPGHVVAISSDGVDRSYPGYDFVAASKSVLEVFTRYMGSHLADEGSRVNAVRFGMVATESFEAMFGKEVWQFLDEEGIDRADLLDADECGKAVLALCSGLLDAMQSEVVTVDGAMAFKDNMMRRYEAWQSDRQGAQEE